MARLSVASIYHTISKLPPTCNLSNGRGLYWWHVMRFWQHLSKDKKIKITKYIQVYYEKAESNLFKTDGLRRLWFHLPQKVYRLPPNYLNIFPNLLFFYLTKTLFCSFSKFISINMLSQILEWKKNEWNTIDRLMWLFWECRHWWLGGLSIHTYGIRKPEYWHFYADAL